MVRISPSERHIAVATDKATVAVLSLADNSTVTTSQLHRDSRVTCLAWGGEDRVYVGDDDGRVSVLKAQQRVGDSHTFVVFWDFFQVYFTPSSPFLDMRIGVVISNNVIHTSRLYCLLAREECLTEPERDPGY